MNLQEFWTYGTQIISNWVRPRKVGDATFYPASTNTWKEIEYLKAFLTIPELNAVINMKGRAHSSGIYKVVNKKGEEQYDNEINKLLKNPNWFQAQSEFIRQSVLFHEIFGNEYILPFVGIGLRADTAKSMFTIPSNLVNVEVKENVPYYLTNETPDSLRYFVKSNSKEIELDKENIIHLNDNRVDITDIYQKDFLKGESKLKALTPAINNIRMAYESRGVILKYRGALGILSNAGSDVAGVTPVRKKDKKRIQEGYQQYGGLDGQFQVIITDANLKWQQMSVNPDKLGLFQEVSEDFNKILDAFGVPSELFVRTNGSTYENQKQARKGLYSETVIPEANERATAMSAKFFPDNNRLKIVADFTHLPVFQESLKERADAVSSMVNILSVLLQDNQITNEEYRTELAKLGIGDGQPIPEKPKQESTEVTTEN